MYVCPLTPVLAASQARIGDTIEGFYSDSSETAMVASTYKRSVEELDARTAKELDLPYRATVLDPISKLSSYFPEVNKLIEKRNRKVCRTRLYSSWTTTRHAPGTRSSPRSRATTHRNCLGMSMADAARTAS